MTSGIYKSWDFFGKTCERGRSKNIRCLCKKESMGYARMLLLTQHLLATTTIKHKGVCKKMINSI